MTGTGGWTVEGVIRCPGACGLYFDFCGTPQDLNDFIAAHDCAKQRMCQAHPDDCPLGPEPHEFTAPAGTGPCCCRQPWEEVPDDRP